MLRKSSKYEGNRTSFLFPSLTTLNRKTVILIAVTIAVFIFAISTFFTSCSKGTDTGLVIESSRDSEKRIILPLQKDDEFIIKYTHSVDRVPVYEYYRIDEEGNLVLEMMENSTFGAGLGDQMGELHLINGRQVVKLNLVQESLPLRLGPIANHTVTLKNHSTFIQERDEEAEKQWELIDTFEKRELVNIFFQES